MSVLGKVMLTVSKTLYYTIAFSTGLSTRIRIINDKNIFRKRAE